MGKKTWALLLVAGMCALATPQRAAAEDKGIIALQQAVSLLISQVTDLQKTVNTQFGLIQGLVSQNTDTVNKLSSALDGIQRALNGNQVVATQQAGDVSKQFQSLADSIAELQAHLQSMDQTLKQVQQMQQTIPTPNPAGAAPGGVTSGAPMPGDASAGAAAPGIEPGAGIASATAPPAAGPAAALQAYNTALSDFQANSPQAQGELASFIRTYPDDAAVPDATYYLGTIYMQKQQYNEAVDCFTRLIEQYPNNSKAGPAELDKGISLAKEGNRTAAISELRAVGKNYPGTQAARQADIELRSLNPGRGR